MNRRLPSVRDRLTDRTKWPRSWWWPLPVTVQLDDEGMRQQHDQTSTTINNVLLLLIGFCFFCWLALGGLPPDVSEQRVTVPFAGAQVFLDSFLLIGPLVLIGFYVYLHIFIGYWTGLSSQLQSAMSAKGHGPRVLGLPFIFNLPARTAGFLSNLLLYWLVPITLADFAWTARPGRSAYYYEEEAIAERWLIVLAAGSSVLALILLLRRRGPQPHRVRTAIYWVATWTIVVVAILIEAYVGG